MQQQILVLNMGSTSTKIAFYIDEEQYFKETIRHTEEELAGFKGCLEQSEFRGNIIKKVLVEKKVQLENLTAICSRGGRIPPCASGAIKIDQNMVDYLNRPEDDKHAAALGCIIAFDLSKELDIPAYVYDPVSVDEITDLARVSGLPELPHFAVGHALNTRAMAIKCANEIMKKPFSECTFIVAHIGGGVSIRLFKDGRNIDAVNDDNGGFAPERAGSLDAVPLIQLSFSGKYTEAQLVKMVRGNGGLKAHLGTTDGIEIEKRINSGDAHAKVVYEAMAYNLAKDIGRLAVPVAGKVDRIILTGGVSYSKYISEYISKLVSFIAPVELMPGEYEMEALAAGALRVLKGEEEAGEFQSIMDKAKL